VVQTAWTNSSARPYLEKPFTKTGLVEWFKVKALNSSPSTEKKKKKSGLKMICIHKIIYFLIHGKIRPSVYIPFLFLVYILSQSIYRDASTILLYLVPRLSSILLQILTSDAFLSL
jgi:hypothetical protein